MSRKVKHAAAVAVAAMLLFTISGVAASGAFAQDEGIHSQEAAPKPFVAEDTSEVRFVSQEVVQPLPEETDAAEAENADTLEDLVASLPANGTLSKDMRCLAGAIYFEARGEPLLGQLAVGNVIVNRAESDRFPSSYCGVVYQRSQFSFVRGGHMPRINTSSAAWHNARAIAKIAHEGLWNSPAEDALFFHASYVKPGWHLTRIARVSRHVFYR